MLEDLPIQQIEIIKPVIDVKPSSKDQTGSKNVNKDGQDKGKKKKKDAPVSSSEAMNSFIKKIAGSKTS